MSWYVGKPVSSVQIKMGGTCSGCSVSCIEQQEDKPYQADQPVWFHSIVALPFPKLLVSDDLHSGWEFSLSYSVNWMEISQNRKKKIERRRRRKKKVILLTDSIPLLR